MFWVTDNFLMRRTHKRYQYQRDSGLLRKVKVKYHRIKKQKLEDEEQGLVSADEELLGAEDQSTSQVNGTAIT